MKKSALILLYLFILFPLSGQHSITGRVTDEQNDPLPRASLRVQAGSKMIKFTTSDNEGGFSFVIDSVGASYLLITAYLGKRADTLALGTREDLNNLGIRLTPALEALPSVEVIGNRTTAFNKSDTTVYQTETYRDSSDRRIEDVLRKIPGVEIAESGAIEVNGKPLYRLLIEDADLFQADYQLGSKNLRAKDIKSVEVVDHYQENQALRTVNNSDKIVLNLRLEDDVKATVAGNGIAGGGYGGGEAKVYNHLNAFLIGKRHKFITLLDWNNVGQDNGAEFKALFPDENDWTVSPYDYVDIGDPYELDLLGLNAEYLDNTNRRLATLRQDSKLGERWHLSLNLTGKGNRREQSAFYDQELITDPELFRFSQANQFNARQSILNVKGQLDYVAPDNRSKLDIYFNAEQSKRRVDESITQDINPFFLNSTERGYNFQLSSRYTKELSQGLVAQFGARIGRADQKFGGTISNRELIILLAGEDSLTATSLGQQLKQQHHGHQAEAKLFWKTDKILHEFTANYEEENFYQGQKGNERPEQFMFSESAGLNRRRASKVGWSGIINLANKYKLLVGAKGAHENLYSESTTNYYTYDLNACLETILKKGARLRFTGSLGNRLAPFTNSNPLLFVPTVFAIQQKAALPTDGEYVKAGIHFQRKNDLKFRDFQLSLNASTTENAPTPELEFIDQLTLIRNQFNGRRRNLSLRARQSIYFPTVKSDVAISVKPQYVGFQYQLGDNVVQGDYFAALTTLELTVTPLPRLRLKTRQSVNWRRPRGTTQPFVGWRGNGSLTLDRKGWSVAMKTSFARNDNGEQSTFYVTESVWLQVEIGEDSRLHIEAVNIFNRQTFQSVMIDDQFITLRGVNGLGKFIYATVDFNF